MPSGPSADRLPSVDEGLAAVAPDIDGDGALQENLASLVSGLDAKGGQPGDFSNAAVDALLDRRAEFVGELGLEAIRLARRSRADVVSASDVARADSLIRHSRVSRKAEAAKVVGGLFGGAGLGQMISVLSTSQPSTGALVFTFVSIIVGAVLLTYGLMRSA